MKRDREIPVHIENLAYSDEQLMEIQRFWQIHIENILEENFPEREDRVRAIKEIIEALTEGSGTDKLRGE